MFSKSLIVLTLSFVGTLCYGDQPSIEAYVLCKSGKIARTIRVEKNSEGSCETIYTKAGISQSIGTVQFENNCLRFLKNVQSNLESAHWKCRDISTAFIDESYRYISPPKKEQVAEGNESDLEGSNDDSALLPDPDLLRAINNASRLMTGDKKPSKNNQSLQ